MATNVCRLPAAAKRREDGDIESRSPRNSFAGHDRPADHRHLQCDRDAHEKRHAGSGGMAAHQPKRGEAALITRAGGEEQAQGAAAHA